MKTMKKMLLTTALLICAVCMNAQKVSDKEIVGTWIMESMQWDGEKLIKCGKAKGYTQFKFYGANGEYACAALALTKEGECVVMPHEYGTYSLKDGWYMEMGRKPLKDAVILLDKTTYKGRWNNRTDVWKKVTLPDKLVRYIVDCCKAKDTPDDIQQLIKKHIFK